MALCWRRVLFAWATLSKSWIECPSCPSRGAGFGPDDTCRGFLIQSFYAARQAGAATESLEVSVLRDADRAFWTRTTWRDEAAVRAFMLSGVHYRVMARFPDWCDEAALAYWHGYSNFGGPR